MYGQGNLLEQLTQNVWSGSGAKLATNTAFPTAKAASTGGANTDYLSAVNPASLRVTDTDSYIVGGWVKLAANPLSHLAALFTKGDVTAWHSSSTGNFGYAMWVNTDGTLSFEVRADNSNSVPATPISGNELAANTLYFVVGYVNAATGKVGVMVNNVLMDEEDLGATNVADFGGDVGMFANPDGNWGFNGTLDEWFFAKNPVSLTNAFTVVTKIYNSGTGKRIYTLGADDRNALGLVSWWTLDDAASGNRTDSFGAVTLTKHGTVSQVTALVS